MSNKGLLDNYYTSCPEYYFNRLLDLISMNSLINEFLGQVRDKMNPINIVGEEFSMPNHKKGIYASAEEHQIKIESITTQIRGNEPIKFCVYVEYN